jgi:EAL domain-containing protein (putative c-di-GMP-specific phosphodiesterase class I)
VSRLLAETGLEPSRLELELTEGVIVENEEDAVTAMAELRDQGVRLALDDFGTGYSSLIYLRRFAFDKIKIDKAFIEALEPVGEGAILVNSVVSLGRALGLTVTAEGIEHPEQLEFLKSLGCHELQGFLIARPLSGPELGAFLAQNASGCGDLSPEAASSVRAVA